MCAPFIRYLKGIKYIIDYDKFFPKGRDKNKHRETPGVAENPNPSGKEKKTYPTLMLALPSRSSVHRKTGRIILMVGRKAGTSHLFIYVDIKHELFISSLRGIISLQR